MILKHQLSLLLIISSLVVSLKAAAFNDPNIYISKHNTSPTSPSDGSINNPYLSLDEAFQHITQVGFALNGWKINPFP